MRTFTKQSSAVRRRALLEAASRLFRAHGYADTRMSAIAREAGLSKGGVYFHFPSKDALLLATLAFDTEQFDQRLRDRANTAKDGNGRLTLYITEYLDALGTGMPLDLWVQALRLPEGVELLRAAYQRGRDDLANLLSDRSGQPDQAAHRLGATLVLALLDGLDWQSTIDPHTVPEPVLLRQAVVHMIQGLDDTHG